jgi:hypothetical protein
MLNPSRRVRSALTTAVLTLTAVLAFALPAEARTQRFEAFHQQGRVFFFKVAGIKASELRSARVEVRGLSWRVNKRRLRRGVRRGHFRAYAPRRVIRRLRSLAGSAGTTPAMLVIRARSTGVPGSPSNPTGTGSTGGTGGTGGGELPVGGYTPEHTAPCDASPTEFGPGNWPSACWRPYSDDSPWNTKLDDNPKLASGGDRIVDRILGYGPLQHMVVGEAGKEDDFSHPTYWSQPNDPWFTLHCTENWGRCRPEGDKIQIPDEAMIPTGSDGHMTVVDPKTGIEYDFWQVQRKPKGGGTLTFSWGDKTSIYGNAVGVHSNAGDFAEMAGLIRAEELAAGRIDHALFLFVTCDNGTSVYPAKAIGQACDWIGRSNKDAPPMGTRIKLDMTPAEIDALAVPEWRKTIFRAMAEYGMIIGDTGGEWGLKLEGGITYTSFGYKDKFVDFAKKMGIPYSSEYDRWIFNLRDGVDWKNRLKVVAPCESEGTC